MRILPASTAVALLAFGLVAASVSPAAADVTLELPEGETFYAVECDASEGGFGSIDVLTAEVTLIGTGTDHPNVTCAGMAAYNPVNGLGYWSSWDIPGDLFSVNLETGEHTFIGNIEIDGADPFWLEHMAIGADGVGYGIANFSDGGDDVRLVSIDLATAEATLIGEFGTDVNDYEWWSFAFNPADGSFYAVEEDTATLYRVNVVTGALTSLGVHGDEWIWYGISFDSEGTIWSACIDDNVDEDFCFVGNATIADWSTPGTSELGDYTTVGDEYWFTEATLINYDAEAPVEEVEPEPELAATGTDDTIVVAGFAAMLLLIAGVTLAMVRRRA